MAGRRVFAVCLVWMVSCGVAERDDASAADPAIWAQFGHATYVAISADRVGYEAQDAVLTMGVLASGASVDEAVRLRRGLVETVPDSYAASMIAAFVSIVVRNAPAAKREATIAEAGAIATRVFDLLVERRAWSNAYDLGHPAASALAAGILWRLAEQGGALARPSDAQLRVEAAQAGADFHVIDTGDALGQVARGHLVLASNVSGQSMTEATAVYQQLKERLDPPFGSESPAAAALAIGVCARWSADPAQNNRLLDAAVADWRRVNVKGFASVERNAAMLVSGRYLAIHLDGSHS